MMKSMTDKKKIKNTNVNYSTIKSQLLNSAKNFSGMKWKFKGMKKLGKWQEEAEVKEKEKRGFIYTHQGWGRTGRTSSNTAAMMSH